LLKDKKKPKAKTPLKKSKGKQKEGESSSSTNTENDSEPTMSSSEEEDNSENGSTHSKRMSKLEQRFEAVANRDGLQEVGIIRPYPAEWDTTPYPPKFKA